jgi:hypothetical protein
MAAAAPLWKGITPGVIQELAASITADTASLRTKLIANPGSCLEDIVNGPWTKVNPSNARAKWSAPFFFFPYVFFPFFSHSPSTNLNLKNLLCRFLDMVHPDPEVRKAASDAREAIASAKRSVFSDEALFRAVHPVLSKIGTWMFCARFVPIILLASSSTPP